MIKPQDIVVLIKLLLLQEKWTIAKVASSIHLSASETHSALRRLEEAGLYDKNLRRPRLKAAEEFLIHGLKYLFPAKPGANARGIPTAHSAEPLKSKIVSDEIYVWPYALGSIRGIAIEPLYPSVPTAANEDPSLYEWLALIDGLRIGRTREKNLAENEIKARIHKHAHK